ncbi:uncharacterized protein LOC113215745 isoform X2 [Frankliniella occidentalis]|uniref:Uncharacterized protein LOC113215745 isoform X2 n=1 Tax=Frankliniella occidentalis TaxID=133901 RepID=A0A9C6XTP2_FRAOC|nr:uncharacterized protein LOC113215745 isoform X2 [Frankliniella occidentalis]
MSDFFFKFENCVENLIRNDPDEQTTTFTKSKVAKGKKLIGVDPDAYSPAVVESTRQEQIGTKEHLKNISLVNIKDWDWVEIKQDLCKTYSLQREDVLLATEDACKDQVPEDDILELRSLEKLKIEWPFLFTAKGLEIHHNLLTKRDLGTKCASFMKEHLEVLLHYLTSCTKSSNVDNLFIRLRVEMACRDVSIDTKLLMMVQMLSNHFKEAHLFSSLFVPVERTVQPSSFQYTVLEEIQGPCVVAQDTNIYAAKAYFVCADKVHLVEVSNPKEALVALFELCFCLNLEYPELSLTFEFLERYVFEVGLVDTRVKKRGKQVVVLSDQVKRLMEGFEEFVEQFKKELPEYLAHTYSDMEMEL